MKDVISFILCIVAGVTIGVVVIGAITPANDTAICDYGKVLAKYAAGTRRTEAWQAALKAAQEKIATENAAIAELDEQLATMKKSGDEYEAKVMAIANRKAAHITNTEAKSKELEASRQAARKTNDKAIRAAVADVAKAKGYNIVLTGNGAVVLYAAGSVDVTGEVVERVNKE